MARGISHLIHLHCSLIVASVLSALKEEMIAMLTFRAVVLGDVVHELRASWTQFLIN